MDTNVLIFAAIGVASATAGALATFKQGVASAYVRTSPKAWIWRKMLGEERVVRAVERVFGPMAIGVGVVSVAVAIWLSLMP